MIGCRCSVCTSSDLRDRRLRTSAIVEYEGLQLVIDAGPDFRQQMLAYGASAPDAVLLTHMHKDHTGGLDDVRAMNYFTKRPFPVYCEEPVNQSLRREYSYAFSENPYPGAPSFDIRIIDENPFTVNGIGILPLRVMHAAMPILGFRFSDLSYITDGSHIPEKTYERLEGTRVLVINCVRREKHMSHFCLGDIYGIVERIKPEMTYLTHISHQLGLYADLEKTLPENIKAGFDGMSIEF